MSSSSAFVSDLSAAVREVVPAAARGAARADAERRLDPDVVAGISAAGFARHFVPRRWGGAAGSTAELLDAVSALAQGCTSAAWSASVIAGAARMGAYLPEEGQRALWAEGADTTVVGALMPRGTATPVPGGWRVTGEWAFTSAVGFSDWALVCALAPTGNGAAPWFFALPRRDYAVRDTWTSLGMRGTGSDTLVADNVLVPGHLAFAREDMLAGRAVGSDARCHTAPLRLVSGLLFGAPALGAAQAAVRVWARDHGPAGEESGPRLTTARATVAVDAARLLLERAAQVADAPVSTAEEQARTPAECAWAVERLVETVEGLLRASGSSSQLEGHPLGRIWRDVHSLASHVALRFDPAGAAYGGHLLDLACLRTAGEDGPRGAGDPTTYRSR
jgi:two-component flavin-dependent monooxygenase